MTAVEGFAVAAVVEGVGRWWEPRWWLWRGAVGYMRACRSRIR